MKKISTLMIFALIAICHTTFSQGINFAQRGYKEALAQAKSENKMLMVDFYTDWCVPCRQMEQNLFTQQRVGDAVNPNFVSIRIDAEKGEGVELASRFKVAGYPTIIFLTNDDIEKYRLRGAPLNVTFLLEVVEITKGKKLDLNEKYESFKSATDDVKLKLAREISSVGKAHYALMSGKEQSDLIAKVKEVSEYYFANMKIEDMINEIDFEIISMFMDGPNGEKPQIEFMFKNYAKFKEVVSERELASFAVKVNNESIQEYSKKGDLYWKKFVNYISNELAPAYELLGEKNAKELMSLVAGINGALYVDKNYDRYITIRDRYSKVLIDNNMNVNGNYLYATQMLYRASGGKLSAKQIAKCIVWLDKNEEEGFNLPLSYMLKGDLYALNADTKAEAIANYNRCVMAARKQGEKVEQYYKQMIQKKITGLNNN